MRWPKKSKSRRVYRCIMTDCKHTKIVSFPMTEEPPEMVQCSRCGGFMVTVRVTL